MKPQDLDDRTPIEPDDALLASVHARSRSFRRRRNTQRLTSITAGLLVVVLATGIAWTRADDGGRTNPIPLATTTTTPTSAEPITQTAIVGRWLLSTMGTLDYTGPLKRFEQRSDPWLSFDDQGRWRGSDGCNTHGGTYRLEERGVHFLTFGGTLAGCMPDTPDFEQIEAAPRSEIRDDELTFLDSHGVDIARFIRADVTARIELPATTIKAGSTMSGRVVIENNTGRELHETGCGSLFQVSFESSEISWQGVWTDCLQQFTIPVGSSSYPISVTAAYASCGDAPQLDMPKCLDTGAPPLPPGRYRATLLQRHEVVSPPAPIEITVEP